MKACNWCTYQSTDLLLKKYKYWNVYLAENQNPLGWCHIVLKRHVLFFDDLTKKELIEGKKAIRDTRQSLQKAFKPDWYNVMQLGNMDRHLHFQLVPRYKKPRRFAGKTFIDKSYGNIIKNRWKPEDKKLLNKIYEQMNKTNQN